MSTEDSHPVDVKVGANIRKRRKELRLSQQQLAESIGLTFQQVQKYERGSNRVSASMLFEIARTLKVSPAFFFEEILSETDDIGPLEAGVGKFLQSGEGVELAQWFPKLTPSRRRAVVTLVRSMLPEQD